MKLISSPEDELTTFTEQTLRYLRWTVIKVCTLIEATIRTPYNPDIHVSYELQSKGEERSKEAPAPAIEASLMQKLIDWGFFKFKPQLLESGQILTFPREHTEQMHELFGAMENDLEHRLKDKFSRGMIVNYNFDLLKKYLTSIEWHIRKLKEEQSKFNSITKRSFLQYFPKDNKKYKKLIKLAILFQGKLEYSYKDIAGKLGFTRTSKRYGAKEVSPNDRVDHLKRTFNRTLAKKKVNAKLKTKNGRLFLE